MGLKFNLAVINNDDINRAKENQGGRYDGPTPPADFYNVKIRKAWFVKFKNSDNAIRVMLTIDEKGPKKIYNGCPIFYSLTLPENRENEHFTRQLSSLISFVSAGSNNKIAPEEFINALREGKVKTEEQDNRGNIPVTQIGKFRFDKEWDIVVKTKLQPNERDPEHPWINVHYVQEAKAAEQTKVKEPEEDDIDVDLEDEDDDLDDLMEGFDE